MFSQNLLMENMKGFRPLHLLNMLSYSLFVYAFANVLKRCVVTMVSNVSDSSDAWPGMLLHAHVTAFSNDKQSRLHTRTYAYLAVCMYVRMYVQLEYINICSQVSPFQRHHAYKFTFPNVKRMGAKVQRGVCQDETAAASCMSRETSCYFSAKSNRSAKISTNQQC